MAPITVSLEGVSEAIEIVKESIVPWRRKHADVLARLSEQEKNLEIELKKAEILEKRAHAQKARDEAAQAREEAEKLKLENDKLMLELRRSKIDLALEILKNIAPNLSEAEKLDYVVRLLPPIDTLLSSEVQIENTNK